MNRAQLSPFPVVQLGIVILAFVAIVPYYKTYSVPANPTLGAFTFETVTFIFGFFPWVVSHPVQFVLFMPVALYLFLVFSRPLIRAKPL